MPEVKIISSNVVKTVTVNITVELSSSDQVPAFMSHVRAFGKNGVEVTPEGSRRVVPNIEKSKPHDNIRQLITTLADEPDGLTARGISDAATALGYNVKNSTMAAGISALVTEKRLEKLGMVEDSRGIRRYVYRTVKKEVPR